jgi:adenylate cyclase class IV
MPLEKELKFLEVDKAEVIARLKQRKARLKFNGTIRAVYFHDKSKDDRVTNRVRKKTPAVGDPVSEWTIKEEKSRNGARTCDETEVIVEGFKRTRQMLQMNGLVEIRDISKHRLSYELPLDDEEEIAHIDIDEMTDPEGVPPYLEIEAVQASIIRKAARVLGLKYKDGKPWSTKELLEHYEIE